LYGSRSWRGPIRLTKSTMQERRPIRRFVTRHG
jgi:hypothetical protein